MWIGIIIGLLLAAVLLAAYYAYRVAFYAAPRKGDEDVYMIPTEEQYAKDRERLRECIGKLDKIEFQPVTIRSFDGRKLFGRYYHIQDGAPLQIQFHGYRGSALRDLCGGTPLALKLGHNVLLVDQRSHGQSDGNTITFGVLERKDCVEWIKYAQERFGAEVPIVLTGVSMGAATVLMASALPLPENVVGIIADCPYSSPKAVIRKVCRDMHFPVSVTYPFIRLGARLLGGFSLTEEGAVDAVRESRVPILILHGEDDRFVPCEMSREIAKAAPDKVRLETFPGAGHALSYMVDPERYRRVTAEFLQSCVNAKRS